MRQQVKYCDGSSFSGHRNGTVDVRGQPLYFRGRENLRAVISTLMSDYGLSDATEVILSGGSAG